MKRTKKAFLTALTLAALSAGAWAEDPAPGTPAAKTATAAPAPPVTAADVQALKDALAAQQQQIERLTQQLQRQQDWQSQQSAKDVAAKTDATQVAVVSNSGLVQQNSAPSGGLNMQDTPAQTPANPP